jgi:predicted RNA-binding Zn ribbon-like protein
VAPRYDVPKAAPGPLRQVQLFINTVDLHNEVEWLDEWLGGGRIAGGLARARKLREALRSLVLANNGIRHDPAALEVVNRELESVSLELDRSGSLAFAKKGDAIDDVMRTVAAAMLDGSWERLKACPNCRWCFYDYSPNRSAAWCSMQLCGNRKKTRDYRRRLRASAPAAATPAARARTPSRTARPASEDCAAAP